MSKSQTTPTTNKRRWLDRLISLSMAGLCVLTFVYATLLAWENGDLLMVLLGVFAVVICGAAIARWRLWLP